MTHLIHHTWLQRSFAVLAIAALLFTAASSPASANKEVPQDITTDEFKEFCELAGGDWVDMGSGRATCFFPNWYMDCDGTTCYIFCYQIECIESRNASSTLRQASLADDQKVFEPATTPTPSIRDRGRSTTADEPMVVEPATTPTPTPRGRGRTTIADQPVFVAPISTPTPEPTKFTAPDTQPVANPNKG